MKNTHPMFRAISLAIGLTLLVVTGTAAMMAVFSGSSPRAYEQQVWLVPLQTAASARSPAGDDHLLYQRVARADGAVQWELTPALQATPAPENHNSAVAAIRPTLALDAPDFNPVSYRLQAKPGGFSKTLKSCDSTDAVSGRDYKPKTLAAYDLACNTLG